ncbi:MAG: type II secretion system protein [Leptolyngbyaceae cyanobacterium bins.349]|nr:type II secretion system protein [Leptolyngbyaceae cyanobacterium bins.349]
MVTKRRFCLSLSRQSQGPLAMGFTLLESLVVVLIISALSAIATAIWLQLMTVLNLNTAQDQVYQAIRKAQQNARLSRIVWEFGIRQTADGQVQWAIYPKDRLPEVGLWQSLDSQIQLDPETTLDTVNNVRRIRFNHLGAVNGRLGRVTLSFKRGGRTKRCVIVSTLLGALRSGHDQSTLRDNRSCW